jgi:fluoroacetyl-CoA thioesterase
MTLEQTKCSKIFRPIKDIFKIGDTVETEYIVTATDLAMFNGQMVHPFFSTFALGREAEWCCRQFVLQCKNEDEEGIGTFLNISHLSPALLGESVKFVAEIIEINHNTINCSWEAMVDQRKVASGTQGQKVLHNNKINALKQSIKN